MLENPKINKDLIYNYRGVKTKAPYNTSGWNSVYVAGKIIEKIGPILAINNKEFTISMLLKNLIRDISKDKKKTIISGISTNSKKIKKNYIFFCHQRKKIQW
jgi:hypothetical protein